VDSWRLDGLTALVTGASRNIGLEITRAMAQAGADVVMVSRGADQLEAAAEDVRRSAPGRHVVTIAADIGSPADADRITAEAGPIDVLVNNAAAWGPGRPGAQLDVTGAEWDDVLQANLLGPYRLIAGLFAARPADRPGSIINVLSGSGFLPSGHGLAYGVSKAALWMLTRELAVQLAPRVRVNAIVPGIVSEDGQPRWAGHTEMLASGAVPMGRMGLPTEIAGAAVYLASPAASYTTGTVIFCNGGQVW
jgi:NAD(P)-dependent dehydrogenase (short-subunit alcohol dehydrogenase family)